MTLAPETSAVVTARDLTIAYGKTPVLRKVTLDVHAGDLWCLLGPNGEGKTTFVRTILGLLRPAAGTLTVRVDTAGQRSVGFVPQRCDLNPTLPTTVGEFVTLGLVGLRVASHERKQRVAWALNLVNLEGREDADYWALSGGQRQRVLVARALVRKPTLLILDEPTTGLDPTSEHALVDLIRTLNRREGLTILLVTHDIPLALSCATHAALFHDGRVESGPAASVLTAAHLSATFQTQIGQPTEPRFDAGEQRP